MINEKRKKIISGFVIMAFILFCAVVGWFIGRPMIRFVSEPENFRAWVEEKGLLGRIIFILMVIFQVVIALVPGEPLEIGAGYAFGAIEGTVLCIVGISIGSVIVFSLVRKYGIKLLEVFFTFEKIKSANFLQNEKKVRMLTFLMFLLPGTPKDLLTYFVGVTNLKFKEFIIIASLARIPSVITSTIGGSLLGVEKYSFAAIVFAVTFIISLLGYYLYNHIGKDKK